MYARLIAKTEPVIDIPPDGLIPYVARVSNPDNQHNYDSGPKLLKYLRKHHHWSPFEMVDAVMEIETTRDIARQVLRHRSFSFQEFSQRYAVAPGFVSGREARLQDTTNRQNSLHTDDPQLKAFWDSLQYNTIRAAQNAYEAALKRGIAKEVARSLLPEGLTVTKMYMKGSIRSWLHYCELRMGPETQKEHRELAEACFEELKKHLPEVFA